MAKIRKYAARLALLAPTVGALSLLATGPAWATTGANVPGATIKNQATGANIPTGVLQGSNTAFLIALTGQTPPGAACNFATTGTPPNQDVIQGYFVDSSIVADPSNLQWSAGVPTQGGNLLANVSGAVYSNEPTGPPTASGTGPIPQPITPFNWNNFGFSPTPSNGTIYPGTFNFGIACTLSAATATTEQFWNAQVTFVADSTDPNGFRWEVVSTNPPTPEAPLAIALPLSALALAGVGALVLRRRRRSAAPVG
jgi:MYXO-CTERM domain-containing protein